MQSRIIYPPQYPRDGTLLFANQALADILGYATPGDLLKLGSVMALIAPFERTRFGHDIQIGMQGEGTLRHGEYRALRQDGSEIWVDHTTRVIAWEGARAMQGTGDVLEIFRSSAPFCNHIP